MAVVVAAVALLAGCSLGSGGDEASTGLAPMADAPMIDQAPEALDGTSSENAGSDSDAAAVDRSVITTGWVAITVDDPVAAAAEAVKLTAQADGRVDDRTERPGTDTEPASASLVLRIPADRLDTVLEQLRDLGDVTSVQLSAADVTQQHQDLDARIDALTASVARMKALLAEAADIADLIAIESELTTRQGELDSLVQQREGLEDQIAYSTVSVELRTADAAPSPAPDGFWDGLAAGWDGLLFFLGWLGVAIGVILPWVLAAAVVVAIVLGIVRLAQAPARRREREREREREAQDAAGGPVGPVDEAVEAVEPATQGDAPATGEDPVPRA